MNDLFQGQTAESGPVECLGQTFPSDQARREHYLKLLAEKLKDPEFHKIEGFPIGTDEDILALSDPPYYTACPNPFIADFIQQYGKPYDPAVPYSKEPFAADVSEGKNDPIYNAHSYHTKVPHKAIMRYILHYTQPGDVVFDGFCGTGMTGVAAQLCGDRATVQSLGYRVEADGTILNQEEEDGKPVWKPFSKLGARRAILNDLSPAATFIAYNYNTPVDVHAFEQEAKRILAEVEAECGWMYETLHTDGKTKGRINYTIWSDVFTCPQCAGEVVFWDAAFDKDAGEMRDKFHCLRCSKELTKRNLERAWMSTLDKSINKTLHQSKQVPVAINYSIGKKRFDKSPDAFDLALIEKISNSDIPYSYPTNSIQSGEKSDEPIRLGITHAHHFYTKRNLWVLAALRNRISNSNHKFWVTAADRYMSRMSKICMNYYINGGGGAVNAGLLGTLYIPSISVENSVIKTLSVRLSKLSSVFAGFANLKRQTLLTTQSASLFSNGDNFIDYIFIDPPFGGNIMYSELNFLWEAWLGIFTNTKTEAIESKTQAKGLLEYQRLIISCFKWFYRFLKPGRWMTVEFSNTQAKVWNVIQVALQEAGFVIANVSVLDKKQGSFNSVNNNTSVKQDLVISAYKPNYGLEDRFTQTGGGEESVWDFVRTHLKYLPIVRMKQGELDYIAERDPRILFDRMVAWFVRHNCPVPLSSQEFQAGLTQRFTERDGMVFLPEQAGEYDKKRQQTAQAPQMELFVCDEHSAIDWLTEFLKKRPSTYQEIHPEFISQLGAGWKKHEARPELMALLEDNFLQYEGNGPIPAQIVSWMKKSDKLRGVLSAKFGVESSKGSECGVESAEASNSEHRTPNSELRTSHSAPGTPNPALQTPNLELIAQDRWYVPDPNKAQDLEKKREKALLKDFETYRAFTGRRLKEFRLEVLRAGFKTAWSNKDFATIISVAQKIPEDALQEDEKLLLWYDQALTYVDSGIL
jgi:DNA modification methylase